MKTKMFFIATLITMSCNVGAQTKIDTLTNEKVIKLSKLGLQPSVIINKIQTSHTLFDVSTDDIIKLSENGVPADVINEMMKIENEALMSIANQKDMNDPMTKRKAGIYFYNPEDTVKPIRRIDPTVTATNKSGGLGSAIARAYSHGVAKVYLISSLAGKNSKMQIDDPNPIFYFYFENNSNPGGEDWFFATATSPNEFVLVKLDIKKDSRAMAVGEANAYGSSTGISNKIKVPFDYEEVEDGIYKVTFKKPLAKGEYCFLYASSTPTRYSNDKVFDFGIKIDFKKGK